MQNQPEILSRSKLKEMIERGDDFTLIEVLSEESYRDAHLPGAVNIPGDSLREKVPTIVPDKNIPVVVYCSSPACTASDRAAELLTRMGYEKVFDYRGGKEHWKEGGLPLKQTKMEAATIDA